MTQAETQALVEEHYDVGSYVERALEMCGDADDCNEGFAKHPSVLDMTRVTGGRDLEIVCGLFPDTTVRETRR